ncbi:MAG TPA: hypothetical protein VFP59_01285 [Candidatus Angelobacter sp.]|nr:hypothetical protein [Candidatus Angelobacter sp.]
MDERYRVARWATVKRNRFLILTILVVSVLAALSGCVISPRRSVDGSISPTPTPGPTGSPVPGAAGKLYVSNQSGNSIVRFDNALTATGDIQPAAAIFGPNTGLNNPQFMALDPSADRLFVANLGGSSVLIWDGISTLNGNIAPTRTIGPSSGLIAPIAVALDSTRDLLYVADATQGEVLVFSPASTVGSNAAPSRALIITGASVGGIALDAANDRLYVSDTASNAIGVFDNASTLNGQVTSNRAITGADTGLQGPEGLTLDLSGDLVVANGGNGNLGNITVYANAAGADADVQPIVLIGGNNTTLSAPAQVVLNTASAANEIYVADSTTNAVTTFTSVNTSGGNITPSRSIGGGSTTFNGPRGLALDPTR